MKKGVIAIIIVLGLLFIIFFWVKGIQNKLVAMDEGVNSAWSQVENVYQRRADLIPNLVNVVKGYAAHESSTLQGVIDARARATQIRVDADNLTPEKLAEFQAAQGELSSALGRLLMLTENYPDLKANQNFLELQAQLEGTENRITVERQKFNETTRVYNTYIRSFPRNIIASMLGFEKRAYFEAAAGSEKAPEVKF